MGDQQRYVDEHARLATEALKFAEELEARTDEATAEEREKLDAMIAAAAEARKRRDQMAALAAEAGEIDKRDAIVEEARAVTKASAMNEFQFARMVRGESKQETINIGAAHALRQAVKQGADAKDWIAEQRALSTGTDSSGGVFVPTHTANSLYDFMHFVDGVVAAGAEVLMTDNGTPLELPNVATHVAVPGTAETAESAEIAVSEDTFGTTELGAFNYTGRYDVPNQLLEDSVYNIEDHVNRAIGRHITQKTETRFTNGTGSSMPKGVIHNPAATRTVTTAAATAITYGEILDLRFKLDAGYLPQKSMTCYMMNPAIYSRLLRIFDGDNRPYFQPSAIAGEPDTIHGSPVKYNPYMPGAFEANDIMVCFGNFMDGYVVRMVGNVDVKMSEHAAFTKNQTVMLANLRADGKVRDDRAFSYLKRKA